MKSGQTLIEVLIAFAVTVVIGVGLVTVGLATQKSAAGARNESQATKLAQEYTEKIRVLRDSKGKWEDFRALLLLNCDAGYCVDEFTIFPNAGSPNDITLWTLPRTVSATSPCSALSSGSLQSDVMSGEKVTVGNVDFCRRMTITTTETFYVRATFKVEVSWKEGNNVRTSRAETVLAKWCGVKVDTTNASPCPNN